LLVYFNGVRVCSTGELALHVSLAGGGGTGLFTVPVHHRLSMHVWEPARELRLVLRERRAAHQPWHLLASLFVPLPDDDEQGSTRTTVIKK
jgi:hypothetical protein